MNFLFMLLLVLLITLILVDASSFSILNAGTIRPSGTVDSSAWEFKTDLFPHGKMKCSDDQMYYGQVAFSDSYVYVGVVDDAGSPVVASASLHGLPGNPLVAVVSDLVSSASVPHVFLQSLWVATTADPWTLYEISLVQMTGCDSGSSSVAPAISKTGRSLSLTSDGSTPQWLFAIGFVSCTSLVQLFSIESSTSFAVHGACTDPFQGTLVPYLQTNDEFPSTLHAPAGIPFTEFRGRNPDATFGRCCLLMTRVQSSALTSSPATQLLVFGSSSLTGRQELKSAFGFGSAELSSLVSYPSDPTNRWSRRTYQMIFDNPMMMVQLAEDMGHATSKSAVAYSEWHPLMSYDGDVQGNYQCLTNIYVARHVDGPRFVAVRALTNVASNYSLVAFNVSESSTTPLFAALASLHPSISLGFFSMIQSSDSQGNFAAMLVLDASSGFYDCSDLSASLRDEDHEFAEQDVFDSQYWSKYEDVRLPPIVGDDLCTTTLCAISTADSDCAANAMDTNCCWNSTADSMFCCNGGSNDYCPT